MRPPTGPGRPDLPTALNFLVLGGVAAVLLVSVFSGHRPPVWVVAALLVVQLGLQLWRAHLDPRLRRPGAWVLNLVVIGLLLYTAGQQR